MIKPKICHSIGGMISHRGCFPDVSCINEDGSLNEKRVEYFADIAARACGASMMRILPCLVDDPNLGRLPGAPIDAKYNYTPWGYIESIAKWDLTALRANYFVMIRRICQILNSKGLSLVFPIYDSCHWGSPGNIPHSPWLSNVNSITTFWNVRDTRYNDAYENNVLTALGDLDCYIELCNEPRNIDIKTLVNFTGRLHAKLRNFGIPQNRLISGVEFFLNGKVSGIYESWRNAVDFTDSTEGGKPESQVGYAVVHGFIKNSKYTDIIDAQEHTRILMPSTDGEITTEKEVYKTAMEYFKHKRPDRNRSKRFMWEFLYQGIDRKTGKQTELYGSRGFSRAIHDYFYPLDSPWYEMNINLIDPGISSGVIPGPTPEPTPKPEHEPEPEPKPEPTPEPGKFVKIWKWIKKHWRWVVGVPSITAGILIIFLVDNKAWRLFAHLWSISISYFDIIRIKRRKKDE